MYYQYFVLVAGFMRWVAVCSMAILVLRVACMRGGEKMSDVEGMRGGEKMSDVEGMRGGENIWRLSL